MTLNKYIKHDAIQHKKTMQNKIYYQKANHFTFDNPILLVLSLLWVKSSLYNRIKLIDLLPFYAPEAPDRTTMFLYPESVNDVINGCFIPNISKFKIKLVISFYFIVETSKNENKVIFMNYKISEHQLFQDYTTFYLFEDFMKFAIKTFNKNGIDIKNATVKR